MFRIEDGIIYLTKGDSASINLTLRNANGDLYALQTGDMVKLTVKAQTGAGTALIEKNVHSLTIDITPADTAELAVGQYSCDIQLTTSDAHVYTVFPTYTEGSKLKVDQNYRNFWITPEVSC